MGNLSRESSLKQLSSSNGSLVSLQIGVRDYILAVSASSTAGNLPIAIVQTLGKSSPFNGVADVDLGIAYDA